MIMPPVAIGDLPLESIAYSLIEGLGGASPGKLTMGYKIANQDASEGDTKLYLRRWAIKNLGAILTFIAFVPSLGFMESIGSLANFVIFLGCFAVLGQARLALHDRIAQTAVYHKDDIRS